MSRLLAAQRAFLVPAWGRDLLYRRAGAVPSLDIWPAANKTLADITTGQNLVTFTRASSATYIDSDGAMKVAAVDVPRIDHDPVTGECLGLLIEEQRTNEVRNSNSMTAVVTGSPGTLPSGWSMQGNSNGWTREVVGSGSIGAMNYVDIKLSGTTTVSQFAVVFQSQSIVSAVNGQIWTPSVYHQLVAGSMGNIIGYPAANLWSSGGAYLGSLSAPGTIIPSSVLQRYTGSATIGDASTAFISWGITFVCTIGQTYDFTIRFALPQLEQGAFATSVIPTTGTAATRSADVASITGTNFSSWYRQDEGTVFQLYSHIGAVGANNGLFNMHKTSSPTTDRHTIRAGTYTITVGNVSQATASYGIPAAGALAGIAYAYKADDIALFRPVEKTILTDKSATIPLDVNTLELGKVEGTSLQLNGHIRRITYWPQRLPNSILQTLTQ